MRFREHFNWSIEQNQDGDKSELGKEGTVGKLPIEAFEQTD